jgi:hypothetical protein
VSSSFFCVEIQHYLSRPRKELLSIHPTPIYEKKNVLHWQYRKEYIFNTYKSISKEKSANLQATRPKQIPEIIQLIRKKKF